MPRYVLGHMSQSIVGQDSTATNLLVCIQSRNPFAGLGDMANLMENMKKAQQLVEVEAAKVQEELAA